MWLLSNLCVSVFVCIIISVAAENNCTIPIEEDDHGQNLVHHAHVPESTNEVDYALPFRINVTTCNFTLNFENGTELSKNQYSLETITTYGGNERDHLFFKQILQGKFRLKFRSYVQVKVQRRSITLNLHHCFCDFKRDCYIPPIFIFH